MSNIFSGTIAEGAIQLDSPLDLPDGLTVDVVVIVKESRMKSVERIRRCAGSLSDLPQTDWDELDEIVRKRQDVPFRKVDE